MRKTATKLSKVKINGALYWCVTWPKIGKGRNRQFFKDKTEAETVLAAKINRAGKLRHRWSSLSTNGNAPSIWNPPRISTVWRDHP